MTNADTVAGDKWHGRQAKKNSRYQTTDKLGTMKNMHFFNLQINVSLRMKVDCAPTHNAKPQVLASSAGIALAGASLD
jgi:hypothetical protein